MFNALYRLPFIIGAYCKYYLLNKTPIEKRNRHEISMSTQFESFGSKMHTISYLLVSVYDILELILFDMFVDYKSNIVNRV